jgi:hypothetical protein
MRVLQIRSGEFRQLSRNPSFGFCQNAAGASQSMMTKGSFAARFSAASVGGAPVSPSCDDPLWGNALPCRVVDRIGTIDQFLGK